LPSQILLEVRYAGNYTNHTNRLRTGGGYSGGLGSIMINGTWTNQMMQEAAANPGQFVQGVPNPFYILSLPNQVSALRQPQVPNLDLSLQRIFPIRESVRLQFRADAFNITNSVLFPGPDTNPYDGGPLKQANGTWTGFGTIPPFQNNFPRILQVSLKLVF
jgi:hypothetical protein